MCKNLIAIRPKNQYNIIQSFVPCGQCDECRNMKKTEWTNRLLIEMDYYQKKFGYKVGFITLTYNEEHLPHIPSNFLKNPNEKIPCFNYLDIKRLNAIIRKHLWSKYNLKNGYRYFITCEYGEKHHRPHMHGILLFNPMFNHHTFYQFIEDAWTGTDNQIKNNTKRKTQRECIGYIAPFETFTPKDTRKCGAYVAKYTCKDIEFEQTITDNVKDLTEKEKHELRHYAPFHKQSLGLSRCMLETTDEQKMLKYIIEGVSVIGSAKTKYLPNYLKERLLYTTYKTYNIKTHRFEQTKIYTQTLYKNKDKVYTEKYKQNKMLFEKLQTKEYWEVKQNVVNQRISNYEQAKLICSKLGTDNITKFYTTYYGLPYEKCYEGTPSELIFARYNPIADLSEREHIDRDYYETMTDACGYLMSMIHINTKQQRSKEEEKTDKLKAFWNNLKNH